MRVKIALSIGFDERIIEELPDAAGHDLINAYTSVLRSKPKEGPLFSSFFDVPFRFNEGDIVDNIIPSAFKHNNDISCYSLKEILSHLDRATITGIEFDQDLDGIYQLIWVDL